jgi:soluble lytic murein transglycosylase-like protein
MRTIPSLFLALLVSPLGALASEGVYRYVEKDGTIIYTNVPPPKGKRAKKMKGAFTPPPEKTVEVRGRASTPAEYEQYIVSAATRYRIPTPLVRAIMHAESNFNPQALSNKGASGLMQLMPATAADMYVKDIFDERENIEGGVRYLRVLANMFQGDMVKMIAAYNAGPDAVRRYGGQVPPFAETQGYVRKVLKLYFHYKEREQLAQGEPRETTADDDARDGAGGEDSRG